MGTHRRASVRSHAADIDYGAGTAGTQRWQRGLGAMEGAIDAHGLRCAPIGVGQVREWHFMTYRSIVDDDVQAAKALGDGSDHRIDLATLRDIGSDQHCLAAMRRDFVYDRLTFV